MSPRERVLRWTDPQESLPLLADLSGHDYLQAVVDGRIPPPPIAAHVTMEFVAVSHGAVTFRCHPDESLFNPIGAVHGGFACTMLDSALGCATHTTLSAGTGYTSIEIKVNYLRPVRLDSGPLTCTGRVTKEGRRVAFADAELTEADGRLVATATGALLVIPQEAGASGSDHGPPPR